MIRLVPQSLKVIVPLGLFAFAAALFLLTFHYYVPSAERSAEQEKREWLLQDLSRLQSSLEYLLLKGDLEGARREVAILAFNHDCNVAALSDDAGNVIAATQRAWLTRPLSQLVPISDAEADRAARARGAWIRVADDGGAMRAYGGVRIGGGAHALPASRSGTLFIEYDLRRAKTRAANQAISQSIYWVAWVTLLALALWVMFHFVLTRRVERLVRSAERIARGDLSARSGLDGSDELGRLGRAFDAMATEVGLSHARLRDDIAERARTEEQLRASQASYRAIFDASEDAIVVFEIDNAAVFDANAKACAAYGHSLAQLRRLDIATLGIGSHVYTRQQLRADIARAAAGEMLHFEWKRKGPDGDLHWDKVFLKRVAIGGQHRILALTRDITQDKSAAYELAQHREALHQREKLAALGSMLASVAHELNNPLSVVVARAVLLEEQADPAVHPAAMKIRVAAERCASIVRAYLALVRQQAPRRRRVRIDEVVMAALEITEYALRTSGIKVRTDFADGGAEVLADADQLHQVFTNLLVNAQQVLQQTPQDLRQLHISSRVDRDGRCIGVSVSDNGTGVPRRLRERIFEPYFTTKPAGMGTGIGLWVSQGIVEAHGGTLTLHCSRAGGACFTVRLHRATPGVTETVSVSPAATPIQGSAHRTVLVVDDEAEVRQALSDILTNAGHGVILTASAREALDRLDDTRVDLIVTDIHMPDRDGRALYLEIEQRWPELATRVVFVMGDTLSDGLREFAENHGRTVIEKPFLPEDVRLLVERITANA